LRDECCKLYRLWITTIHSRIKGLANAQMDLNEHLQWLGANDAVHL